MNLTITNTGNEPEPVIEPGGNTGLLEPGSPTLIEAASGVLIVGDKPDVREQIETGLARLASTAKAIYEAITQRRKLIIDQTGRPEPVSLSVSNHGANAVRVILGDGVNEITLSPGQTQGLTSPGYLEFRELGSLSESQLDGGTQPSSAA